MNYNYFKVWTQGAYTVYHLSHFQGSTKDNIGYAFLMHPLNLLTVTEISYLPWQLHFFILKCQ
jgi:hypothetical protein